MLTGAVMDGVRGRFASGPPGPRAGLQPGAPLLARGDSAHCIARPDWPALLRAMALCGPLRVCTHGPLAALEAVCCAAPAVAADAAGLDARARGWRTAVAVHAAAGNAAGAQLHIMGSGGRLLHRIVAHAQTNTAGWQALLRHFVGSAPGASLPRRPGAEMGSGAAGGPALGRGTPAPQGASCVVRALKVEALVMALFAASEDGLVLRPRVGGSGWTRPAPGPVRRMRAAPHGAGRWLEAGGPAFALRWRAGAVSRVWAVRQSTPAGMSHRIVALGRAGNLILSLEGEDGAVGHRRDGWSDLLWSLPRCGVRGRRPDALLRSRLAV